MTTLEQWSTVFDAWAGQDPLIASTGEPSNPEELAAVAEVLADWLRLDGTERVLDVGCASATLTGMWAGRTGQVVGLDLSRPLLGDARRVHSGRNLRFVHGDARTLPFADASFDRVCCFSMLLCLEDQEQVAVAIDELLRVARPGARLVLGGLPDLSCREVFFDHCDAMNTWYRRAVPRNLRWVARRVLQPGFAPGRTMILWFDVAALADRLRDRGCQVAVEYDPELSNYAVYRKSLLVTAPQSSPSGAHS